MTARPSPLLISSISSSTFSPCELGPSLSVAAHAVSVPCTRSVNQHEATRRQPNDANGKRRKQWAGALRQSSKWSERPPMTACVESGVRELVHFRRRLGRSREDKGSFCGALLRVLNLRGSVGFVKVVEDDSEQSILAATLLLQEAELQYGIPTWGFGEERSAMLALRATSLTEYLCASNLERAARERQRADASDEEAERRTPGGRRVDTVAESRKFIGAAARHRANAKISESGALETGAAIDLAAAHLAVAHMFEADNAPWSGSAEQEWLAAAQVLKRIRAWQRKRQQWFYVRGRAQRTPQPPGGLLPLAVFESHEFGGALLARSAESGPAGTIASAVELFARWDLADDPRTHAESVAGALEAIRAVRRGEHSETGPALIGSMFRNDDNDLLDELGWEGDETLAHIAEMRARVSRCFEQFGETVSSKMRQVHSEKYQLRGHIDFVSSNTIWDLKVSSTKPNSVDLLQLLLYWTVAKDDPDSSMEVTHLGICNPRRDAAWRIAVADIPVDVTRTLDAIAAAEQPLDL